MTRRTRPYRTFGLLLGLMTLLPGCTTKATLDSTSDTVSNFLSSTSGRSWLTEDGLVRDDIKAEAFMAINRDHLEQDLARGEGEYLTSAGTLLSVPAEHQLRFRAHARTQFEQLASDTTPEQGILPLLISSARSLLQSNRTSVR
ncbi:exported protein of unknown function [Nitrospira tepida]|uniref:DUF3015 domain-containing protein n=1 Tax=Nitrospira tepida TaxID=2973512 RepID=A0AA86T648_9BACT|nr:DUF3015 family protein [Nitrospira tepida]CAI4031057.1 exported protein of unknown function [Nitrospira tepida]